MTSLTSEGGSSSLRPAQKNARPADGMHRLRVIAGKDRTRILCLHPNLTVGPAARWLPSTCLRSTTSCGRILCRAREHRNKNAIESTLARDLLHELRSPRRTQRLNRPSTYRHDGSQRSPRLAGQRAVVFTVELLSPGARKYQNSSRVCG